MCRVHGRRVVLIILEFCGLFVVLAGLLYVVANNEALRARLAYWWEHRAGASHASTAELLSKTVDIPAGDELDIPSIKVRAPLQSPSASDTATLLAALEQGVVRYPGTAQPGDDGLVFVTGHSSNYAWAPGGYKSVFALLDKLTVNDPIVVFYQGKRFVYRVSSARTISPNDLSVLAAPQDGKLLRLMTCWPVGTTARRLIIEATFD